ncbi:dimethylargininase [Naasia sp. SYSU D00948]|uniref:dimethylargininase n=1 Tax=Naasia sp. SYSU D00948 TaxID=2817379 RepID=UPI0027DE769C|nr:dimethylargininase [Naasia sp. SYSU D00948]
MPSTPPRRRLFPALLSAAVAALAAHLATVLLVFVGNGFNPASIPAANGFFGFGVLIAFLVLAVGGVLGAFERFRWTAVTAVVAALAGALLGTTIGALLSGAALSGALLSGVFASLADVNLVFLAVTLIAALTVAPAVYRSVAAIPPAVLRSGRTALVRLPAANLAEGAVTFQERAEVDPERADAQWAAYVDTFRSEGWDVVEVPAADAMADSVFVEDTVVVIAGLAVLTRPGAEHRRDEVDGTEETLRDLRVPMARIEEPGTLDGGDVLVVGDTVYVGRGGRTNAEGIRQLRALLAPRGVTVVGVPMTRALHLKTAVTALPDGTVLGHGEALDDPRIFGRYLEVPEPEGAQVVVLDPETVLMSAAAPRSAELVRSLGYRVLPVELSEFHKLEGSVTCLSVRIRPLQESVARG